MIAEGQTATNPKTGDRVVYQGGQWHALPKAGSEVADPNAPGASFLSTPAGQQKLSPQDNAFLSKGRTATQQAQSMRADANRFLDLNTQVGTGGILNQIPVVRGAVKAVGRAINPKFGEMEAISEKLTPAMREAGSGAMSDRDVEMYRASTVSVDKLGPTNHAIARVIDAGTRRQGDYQAFMEEWARRNGGLVGAQEAWSAYAEANPLFEHGKDGTAVRQVQPWRQWFGVQRQGGAPAKGSGAATGGYTVKAVR